MSERSTASFPCFSSSALVKDGMLLHLSTGCNMQCRFCHGAREADGRSMDGVGVTIMTADAAYTMASARMGSGTGPAVIELGGPGEPLLHGATFFLLRRLHANYPRVPLSVWTNGLLLPDRLDELVRSGVRGLTLSLTASTPDAAERIYDWVVYRGRRYEGSDAAHLVLQQQWNGLSNAVEAGLAVTACVPRIMGVNDREADSIAQRATEIGAERVVVDDFEP